MGGEGRTGPGLVVGIKGPGELGTKLPLMPSFIRGPERRVVGLFWEGLSLALCQPYYWKHLKGGSQAVTNGPWALRLGKLTQLPCTRFEGSGTWCHGSQEEIQQGQVCTQT